MGNLIEKFMSYFVKNIKAKVLMLGLCGAGKTTTLMKLKLGEHIQTIPTIGFNVEQVKFENCEFNIWDMGG